MSTQRIRLDDLADDARSLLNDDEIVTITGGESTTRRRTFWAYTYTSYNQSSSGEPGSIDLSSGSSTITFTGLE